MEIKGYYTEFLDLFQFCHIIKYCDKYPIVENDLTYTFTMSNFDSQSPELLQIRRIDINQYLVEHLRENDHNILSSTYYDTENVYLAWFLLKRDARLVRRRPFVIVYNNKRIYENLY